MPRWLPFGKARQQVDAAAAIGVGINQVPQWTEDNYENYAREGYGRNNIVFACIQEIATSAADARLRVMKGAADNRQEVPTTPLARLLERPNSQQSQFTFIEMLHTYLQVSGNAYVFKLRGQARQVVELHLLRPDRMQVWPGNGPGGIQGYIYTLDGQMYTIAAEDILHIRRPNPYNDWYGLSPLHVLARTVNLDNDMTAFQKTFFQNAGVPAGFLKVKRKVNDQKEADLIRGKWKAQFSRQSGWHMLGLLDEDADYKQLSTDLDKMAMLDIRNVNEAQICAVFGVPPILVGAHVGVAMSSGKSEYETAKTSLWEETLLPEYRRLVDEFNRGLGPEFPGDGEIEADLSAVRALADDEGALWERVGKAFERGILTLNEARSQLGQEPLTGGVTDWVRLPSTAEYIDPTKKPEPKPVPVIASPGQNPADPGANPKLPPPGKAWTVYETRALSPREAQLMAGLDQAREHVEPYAEGEMVRFFRSLVQRVDGVIGRYLSRGTKEQDDQALPFSADDLLPAGADADLAKIMRAIYLQITMTTWEAINTSGLIGSITFDAGTPPVQRVLQQGSTRVVQINDTTREALREVLRQGVSQGYSIQQIANGVSADGFPGVRSVVTELYKNRATTIARTETRLAQNSASIARYEASGVEHVRAMDGSTDPACAERNGQVFTVAEASAIHDHPNGTLSFVPIIHIPTLQQLPAPAEVA